MATVLHDKVCSGNQSLNKKRLPSDEDDGIHLHCLSCYNRYCTSHPNCNVVQCDQKCGLTLHKCKQTEHANICKGVIMPCINSSFGCPFMLPREQMMRHLEHCPASVIFCAMEWNRYPVFSKETEASPIFVSTSMSKYPILNRYEQRAVREHWVPFSQRNPVKVQGDLDTELAFHDQSKLEKIQWETMKRGKAKLLERRYQTKKMDQGRIELLGQLLSRNRGKSDLKINEIQQKGTDSAAFESSGVSHCHKGLPGRQANEGEGSCSVAINPKQREEPSPGSDVSDSVSMVCAQAEYTDATREATIVPNEHGSVCEFPEKLKTQKVTPYFMKTLGLNVIIETLPKFQKQFLMYNFACAQEFRRDQYPAHFEHVHGDIHGGLNGWIMERCPLAQFGCTYIRPRMTPLSKNGAVVFSHDLGSFGVRPRPVEDASRSCEYRNTSCQIDANCESAEFLSLPLELIETVAGYLDSYSLNNLALTCKTLRDICQVLLKKRGIVTLQWEKRRYGDGSVSWQVFKKRWFFSTAFSPIHQWHYTSDPYMCNHLQNCPFFVRHERKEKYEFPMIGMESILLKNDWA